MNILIYNWRDPKNPASGGAEQVTFGHAKRWVQMGHTVVWFTSSFPHAPKRETLEGITIERRGIIPLVYLFAPFFYWLNNLKFDVVIDEIHGIPFATPLFVRKPIVAFIHEIAGVIWDIMYTFPFNIIGKTAEHIYPHLYKNVLFWTDAESTRKELEKYGIPMSNSTAIPCPIEDTLYKYDKVKKKVPTFVFISRLIPMKGIEDVLTAFAVIRSKLPAARLRVIGPGDDKYVRRLNNRVRELHLDFSVGFYGKVTNAEKMKLLGSSHVLLHAPIKEGWGLVVLEAASVGTPAVVYNVNGLKDVVKNGETGIIVDPNTPEELAKQAVSLYKNRKMYKRFQINGRNRVRSIRWDDVAKQSMNVLIRAIERDK